jgi:hemerythrin-like metal-binding protein
MDYRVIEWKNRYSVGIESLDEQHKQIICMCNNLFLNSHKKDENSQEFFRQTVVGMTRFLQYHFLVEEDLLVRISFPDIFPHKEEHVRFSNFFDRYLACLGTADENSLKKTVPLILDQLLRHITDFDCKYGKFVYAMNQDNQKHLEEDRLPTEAFLG